MPEIQSVIIGRKFNEVKLADADATPSHVQRVTAKLAECGVGRFLVDPRAITETHNDVKQGLARVYAAVLFGRRSTR